MAKARKWKQNEIVLISTRAGDPLSRRIAFITDISQTRFDSNGQAVLTVYIISYAPHEKKGWPKRERVDKLTTISQSQVIKRMTKREIFDFFASGEFRIV